MCVRINCLIDDPHKRGKTEKNKCFIRHLVVFSLFLHGRIGGVIVQILGLQKKGSGV